MACVLSLLRFVYLIRAYVLLRAAMVASAMSLELLYTLCTHLRIVTDIVARCFASVRGNLEFTGYLLLLLVFLSICTLVFCAR
jgi:hypothetical protein